MTTTQQTQAGMEVPRFVQMHRYANSDWIVHLDDQGRLWAWTASRPGVLARMRQLYLSEDGTPVSPRPRPVQFEIVDFKIAVLDDRGNRWIGQDKGVIEFRPAKADEGRLTLVEYSPMCDPFDPSVE